MITISDLMPTTKSFSFVVIEKNKFTLEDHLSKAKPFNDAVSYANMYQLIHCPISHY